MFGDNCHMILRMIFVLSIQGVYSLFPTQSALRCSLSRFARYSLQNGQIPDVISFDDKYSFIPNPIISSQESISPWIGTDIKAINGLDNLGLIIWTILLFNGLFTTSGKPSEWVLPGIAKLVKQTWKPWYIDYSQGFQYQLPIEIEIIRVLFFVTLSYLVNQVILGLFEGDEYWTWAIGLALLIPSSLLTLARNKRSSREDAMFEAFILDKFQEFVKDFRVTRDNKSTFKESRLIDAFERQYSVLQLSREMERNKINEEREKGSDSEVQGREGQEKGSGSQGLQRWEAENERQISMKRMQVCCGTSMS